MLNLYETYYKLSADPFRLSPDHHFAYGHQGYANAKAYLEYAFFQGEGFVMVTGEPGTGKTTLINEILSGLDQSQMRVATLTTTQLDTRDLLHMVAVLFGMRVGEVSKPALLVDLKQYLSEQADRGWRSILVVDEAQGLSASGLEELRLLANLQHRDSLLIQICLIGQDQLRDLVQEPAMEHLRQRIIAASHLTPLTLEETVDYIEHRLCHAGWTGNPSISEGALSQIHQHSGGIPRLINLICNRLFLYGGLEAKHGFVTADACHVIGELQNEQLLHTAPVGNAEGLHQLGDGHDEALSDLGLPRAGSVNAMVQSVEDELHGDPTLADANGDLNPKDADTPDVDVGSAAAISPGEARAELGEPYISASRADTVSREHNVDEPVMQPPSGPAKLGYSRRVMAVMVLLLGLVLVAMFGPESGNPVAERLKAQWLELFGPDSEVRTAAEDVQDQSGADVAEPDLAPVTVNTDARQETLPELTPPVESNESPPEVAPAIDTQPGEESSPAMNFHEVRVVQLQRGSIQRSFVGESAEGATSDDWPSTVADQQQRLEQEARHAFEQRVSEQFPDRLPVVTEQAKEPAPSSESAAQQAGAADLATFEASPPVSPQPEEIFTSLKEVHMALLEGRWTMHGKPAIFLPSEITFCGQGSARAQITCWSVPQYVEANQRTVLQKIEATMQGFSSKGEFELVYRSMNAPAETDDDRLLWQTTEHRLWCEFSAADRVICADPASANTVELMRSPLSNNNSVGIDRGKTKITSG